MKKVINKYFCDHCGKEVKATDKNNPLEVINLSIYDGYRTGYFYAADLQLCSECHGKLKKDIDSVVTFLGNHWSKEKKEEEEKD